MTGWQFDKNIPAIVHPIVDNGRFPLQLDAQPSNRQNPVNWIVVVLNLDYIQRKILPTLRNDTSMCPEGLEYKLAVIDSGEHLG